jgi:Na+/H+ antiporter NhaD/arsenite permease-like protein
VVHGAWKVPAGSRDSLVTRQLAVGSSGDLDLNVLAAVILGATVGGVIFRQLLRRGPPVWVLFLAGAFLTVATGVLPVPAASTAITSNFSILIFLFSLFLFAAGLEQAGALDHLALWVLGRARKPADVPFVLFVAIGILSAFVLNDALVLVGVPLLFALARRMRVSAEPLLLTLAFSVTVGSVPTPFGNPQNLLVSLGSGLTSPLATFLRYLLLPTIVNLLVGGLYLRRVYGRRIAQESQHAEHLTGDRPRFLPRGPILGLAQRYPALVVFPITVIVLITVDVLAAVTGGASVPLYLIALGGAIITLIVSPGRSELFARVEWSILVLFASLFVVVAGAVTGGVIAAIEGAVPVPGPSQPVPALGIILLTSLGGSQLVSNVPWVALQIPILRSVGYGAGTPWAWVALAGGSTLAGNLTLLGAASNLIVVEQAERAGVHLGLRSFVRAGLPLTAITVGTLFAFLLIGL